MMDKESERDLAGLLSRLSNGQPRPQAKAPAAIAKPIYLLEVDEPDERSILLIVRAGSDGVMRATISTPQWHEIEEGWDGPHTMDVAVPLADSYAEAFGYHAIAIDIESSQLWDSAWGKLMANPGQDYPDFSGAE